MHVEDIPIPDDWPALVRKAVLHAASLARLTMTALHSSIHSGDSWDLRMASEVQQRDDAIALLKEQIRIQRTRLDKIPPKHRPHFPRHERLAILALKSRRGWNHKQAAEAFALSPDTIAHWMGELEEHGEDSLVQMPRPINRYPEFVTHIAQQFKSVASCLGKEKIAEYFARAGLNLSASTIGRRLKHATALPEDPAPSNDTSPEATCRITSRAPNHHTWLVDLTAVPIQQGFSCPWSPLSLPQVWPFCHWVCIILDHFSRRIVGFALFKKPPTALEVTDALDAATARAGKTPKYIITDKGTQFFANRSKPENRKQHHYAQWCTSHKITPRFRLRRKATARQVGAVGKRGSTCPSKPWRSRIAIIERFMRTLKDEGTRKIVVPYGFEQMRDELGAFVTWYNEHRPHMTLNARTPKEAYDNIPLTPEPSLLPRSQAPPMTLTVSFFAGRRHLPLFRIEQAAHPVAP